MAEWDWRELLDDPDVTDVVHRVWWYAKRNYYSQPLSALALDDLSSWLWERAADMAMRYDASIMDARDLRDPHRFWLAWLYRGLIRYGLPLHRKAWFGREGSAMRAGVNGTESIEANAETRSDGAAATTDLFANRRLQASDPLAVVLLVERLEEKCVAIQAGTDEELTEVKDLALCAVYGCDEPRFNSYRKCKTHVAADRTARAANCSAEGCSEPVVGRGLCAVHYGRWRASNGPKCEVEGCEKTRHLRGLCAMHYRRAQRAGALPPLEKGPVVCTEPGCAAAVVAKGLCRNHYKQARRRAAAEQRASAA